MGCSRVAAALLACLFLGLPVQPAEASLGRAVVRGAERSVVRSLERSGIRSAQRSVARPAARAAVRPAGRASRTNATRRLDRAFAYDRKRDAALAARPLAKSRLTRRYTSVTEARWLQRHGVPAGKHLTANARGRTMGAARAQRELGLRRRPTAVVNVRVPGGTNAKTARVVGGGRHGELKPIRRLPPGSVEGVKRVR
ncbi:MAG: hypothetical protein FJZ01_19460 [Candidatus Sericytochromatia bacterium]|nr:hypothetical protein [Candidatus Tanganyikabacteria bacterium]